MSKFWSQLPFAPRDNSLYLVLTLCHLFAIVFFSFTLLSVPPIQLPLILLLFFSPLSFSRLLCFPFHHFTGLRLNQGQSGTQSCPHGMLHDENTDERRGLLVSKLVS